jgi:hypothetical protein
VVHATPLGALFERLDVFWPDRLLEVFCRIDADGLDDFCRLANSL